MKVVVIQIKPYLRDIIINLQKSDTWQIQLTIAINFISSKHVDEERVIHSKSNDIKFMLYNNTNKVVNKLFDSFFFKIPIWFRNINERKGFYF